jgi:pilus assembly protein Flp/PilA
MKKFLKDESGATAIEYGLLAALIGSALVGLLGVFGNKLQDGFSRLGESFNAKAKFGTNTTAG